MNAAVKSLAAVRPTVSLNFLSHFARMTFLILGDVLIWRQEPVLGNKEVKRSRVFCCGLLVTAISTINLS